MEIKIKSKDAAEARAIKAALNDPITRATVVIIGTLLPLPHGARRRIMNWIADEHAEESPNA